MHQFYFSRLGLCDEAAETAITTPAAPAAAAAPGAKPAEAAAAATTIEPPKVVKASVVDQAINLFKDKGALGAEIATLKSQLSQITTERDGLRAQLTTVTAERNEFQANFTKLEAALAQANASAVSVHQEVTHQLASVGVPDAQLPKTGGAGAGTTSEDLAKQYDEQAEAASDPVEKGRLSRLAFNIRCQASKKKES